MSEGDFSGILCLERLPLLAQSGGAVFVQVDDAFQPLKEPKWQLFSLFKLFEPIPNKGNDMGRLIN